MASDGRQAAGPKKRKPSSSAALFSRTEPGGEHLAVPAPEPPRQPCLRELRRHRRRIVRRMECPRCRTGPHHLHHDTRLGIGHNLMPLVLISAAMILSRSRPGSEKGTATPKTIEVPPSPLPLSVTPAPVDSVDSSPSAASAATAGDKIEPFLSVVKRYAHILHTGSAPVDDFIRQMEPRVELATKEAVTRAAT